MILVKSESGSGRKWKCKEWNLRCGKQELWFQKVQLLFADILVKRKLCLYILVVIILHHPIWSLPWSSLHLIFVQILQRINSVAERIWWRQQPSRGRMVPPWGVGTSRRSEKQTSQTEIWETNPRFKAEINLRPAECQPEAQRSNSEEASSNPRQFKFTE